MRHPPTRALDAAGLLVRLALAAVWLVSGALKVADPAQTRIAVAAYQVVPGALVGPVATVLPLVELVLGPLLVLGASTRPTQTTSISSAGTSPTVAGAGW